MVQWVWSRAADAYANVKIFVLLPALNCEGFRNHANVILGEKLVIASGGKFDHMNEKVNKFNTAHCGGSQIR